MKTEAVIFVVVAWGVIVLVGGLVYLGLLFSPLLAFLRHDCGIIHHLGRHTHRLSVYL